MHIRTSIYFVKCDVLLLQEDFTEVASGERVAFYVPQNFFRLIFRLHCTSAPSALRHNTVITTDKIFLKQY